MGKSRAVPKPELHSLPLVNEMPVIGQPMPADSSCKIVEHKCSVYPSKLCKYSRRFGYVGDFFRRELKSSRRICLVGNLLCISSTTRNVINHVVDLTKEVLSLDGCHLTIGQWVIILPEGKLSEWKAVSGEQ